MKRYYQFKSDYSVIEIREELQKLVRTGRLEEKIMITLVKGYAEQKKRLEEGQRFIVLFA